VRAERRRDHVKRKAQADMRVGSYSSLGNSLTDGESGRTDRSCLREGQFAGDSEESSAQ
jgi:hypothetical protein